LVLIGRKFPQSTANQYLGNHYLRVVSSSVFLVDAKVSPITLKITENDEFDDLGDEIAGE